MLIIERTSSNIILQSVEARPIPNEVRYFSSEIVVRGPPKHDKNLVITWLFILLNPHVSVQRTQFSVFEDLRTTMVSDRLPLH